MNTQLNLSELKKLFNKYKEQSLFGKWIVFKDIQPLILKFTKIKVKQLATSENNIPIFKLQIGSGSRKILIWSQMHGNESTGTKAIFDLLNVFENTSKEFLQVIKKHCTIQIVPMLNPDGALVFTRVNAKNIDLNRDAIALKAKESNVLRDVLESFQPHFCFNLHDQRTIFGVENSTKPATISFLAPSEEESKAITNGRKQTMNVIVAMNSFLQQVIPDQIGRYTDEFYPTATGDNFQKKGYNTVLIEAGHYPNDYNREEVRKFNFYALFQGIYHIAKANKFTKYLPYFDIPNNTKNFLDVIHRYKDKEDIGYQYKDKIIAGHLVSKLKVTEKGNLSNKYSHYEIVF